MDEVRAFAGTLPRATEVFVRGRIKFRVGSIVFLSFSRDGTLMGFGFPFQWKRRPGHRHQAPQARSEAHATRERPSPAPSGVELYVAGVRR